MSKIVVEMERVCLQECDELRTELQEAADEITALRAALDQERADNAKLKLYAEHHIRCRYEVWSEESRVCTCGLADLLSGRGEGGG